MIQYNNYLHSIYIVLGIISNLQVTKDVHGLYAHIMPFYIRDLSILRFGYLWAILYGYQGMCPSVSILNLETIKLQIILNIYTAQNHQLFSEGSKRQLKYTVLYIRHKKRES